MHVHSEWEDMIKFITCLVLWILRKKYKDYWNWKHLLILIGIKHIESLGSVNGVFVLFLCFTNACARCTYVYMQRWVYVCVCVCTCLMLYMNISKCACEYCGLMSWVFLCWSLPYSLFRVSQLNLKDIDLAGWRSQFVLGILSPFSDWWNDTWVTSPWHFSMFRGSELQASCCTAIILSTQLSPQNFQ